MGCVGVSEEERSLGARTAGRRAFLCLRHSSEAALQACCPAGVGQAGSGPWGTGLGAEGGGGHLGEGPVSRLGKEAVCALKSRRSRRRTPPGSWQKQ